MSDRTEHINKMKPIILLVTLLLPLTAHAALPTTDIALGVNLLPNTQYQVSTDVSTSAVSSLLALLPGDQSPIQIVDSDGNVLGQVSTSELTDLLQGLVGSATVPVTSLIQTGTSPVNGLMLRVLDTPLLATSNTTVTTLSPARANQNPTVRITRKNKSATSFRLRGTASDDVQVTRVEVRTNGRIRKAHGTTRWNVRLPLRQGMNRVTVRAFDNSNAVSAPAKTRIVNP